MVITLLPMRKTADSESLLFDNRTFVWLQSCSHCSLASWHLSSVAHVHSNLGAWVVDPFMAICIGLYIPFAAFLRSASVTDVLTFNLCRNFSLGFCVDIDEHNFCSCPSEDPGILTQWMIFEIVFDWCQWSTFHMCLLKLRMGYLLSWLGWFANQVEAHNLWWLR